MGDIEERQEPFGAKIVRDMLTMRLTDASHEHANIVNRLWAGNGAGAVASISLIAAAAQQNRPLPLWWLAPPAAFVLALLVLCLGTILRLWDLRQVIQDLEHAEGVLDIPARTVRRPSHEVGLYLGDVRTICGIAAALLFVVGTLTGVAAVYGAIQ